MPDEGERPCRLWHRSTEPKGGRQRVLAPAGEVFGLERHAQGWGALRLFQQRGAVRGPDGVLAVFGLSPAGTPRLVKSEKENPDCIVGREFAESYGGRVVLTPAVPGLSTSERLAGIAGKDGYEWRGEEAVVRGTGRVLGCDETLAACNV